MKGIKVNTFQPTGDQKPGGVMIIIDEPIPEHKTLEAARDHFDNDAQKIFEALRNNLPGGTIDWLAGKLLAYKASHFYVNHEDPKPTPAVQQNLHLSEAQRRLVDLDLRKPEIEKYYEELESVLRTIADENGIGSYFKADDGIVYKITVPDGKYVPFNSFAFLRTKREGERAGSLSMKEADAAMAAIAQLAANDEKIANAEHS